MSRVHSPSAHTHRAAGLAVVGLIERLEKAEAGSRELDGQIEVVARWAMAAQAGLAPEHRARWKSGRLGQVYDGNTGYDAAPVTTSLDAALALAERVLPGWHWHEITGPRTYLNIPTPVPNRWCAKLDDERGWGATPSLALCAAVLRATTPAEADAVGTEPKAECTQ